MSRVAALAAAFLLSPFLPPHVLAEPRREPSWDPAVAEYRQLLAELIAIDSTSPPGNELRVAARLRALLEQEGIACDVFEAAEGRGNLVARLRGSGKHRPLLLLAHMDVVGVERDKWRSDPFQMTERDGYLYARGVIDDKGMLAAETLTLVWLKRLGVALDRDVIFMAESDEESGGALGVDWMLEHHREAIDAEYAINEGGRVFLGAQRTVAWVGIQSAEKRRVPFRLVARGTAGHASIPRPDNSIAALGRALAKFSAPAFPVTLTPETRAFFPAIAAAEPDAETAHAMRHLDHPDSAQGYAQLVAKNLMFDALLRHTVSPTLVKGGFRENAIPSEAEATLDCRLLPGTAPEWMAGELRRLVGDPQVEITYAPPARPEAPPVPFAGPVVEAVRSVCGEMAPGAPVVPLLATGASDSAQLRAAGIAAYGLLPFPLGADDVGRMHGNEERMPLASLEFGLKMMYRVTVAVAGAGG
jgi:acetylornithine deacetylase/succinyl-diaminopimelate desuccinylase-like protein